MRTIENWLLREKQRSRRQPRLEDALLGRRPIAYVAYRLRFVTLRVVLRTALHIVEVVALSQVIAPRYLGPILLMRHSALIFSNLYWGALEAQRIALRQAHRRRDNAAFADQSSRWSVAAAAVIVLQQLLVAGYLLLAPRPFEGFSIYDAYAIACGLRLGLDTWSRTRQSAVFAVARVRRPLSSLVAVDIIEVFGLLIAWLQIGAFAFALMLVLAGMMRAGFTLWFTRATRDQLGLPKPARSLWRECGRRAWLELPLLSALKFAVLNASLQIDSLAIVLLSSGFGGSDGVLLGVSLHALSPLLGAGFAWTRVFYFDFIRLGAYVCPLLASRFGRLLDRVAIVYPILLAILVLPVVGWLAPGLLAATESLLGVFVVARSLYALRQMEAYSYADHRTQIRQAAILLLIVAAVWVLSPRLGVAIVGITVGLVLAALVGPRARMARPEPERGVTLCVEAFIAWLMQNKEPLSLAQIEIDQQLTTIGKVRLALLRRGFVAPNLQIGQRQLVVAVPGNIEERALRVRLITAVSGTSRSLKIGPTASNGTAMCARLLSDGLPSGQRLTEPFRTGSAISAPPSMDAAAIEFGRQFPDGVHLTSSAGNVGRLGDAARGELRAILAEINANRAPSRRHSRHVEVAVYRPVGEATQLFILPRTSPRLTEFVALRERIVRASVHDSFAAAISSKCALDRE